MHELSLCHSIKNIALKAAQGRRVSVIELDIGELRQVIPATLEYCWGIVREDAADLAGSDLAVNRIPVRIRCKDCQAETTITKLAILKCASCGGINIEVVSGEEFMVTALQLEG